MCCTGSNSLLGAQFIVLGAFYCSGGSLLHWGQFVAPHGNKLLPVQQIAPSAINCSQSIELLPVQYIAPSAIRCPQCNTLPPVTWGKLLLAPPLPLPLALHLPLPLPLPLSRSIAELLQFTGNFDDARMRQYELDGEP